MRQTETQRPKTTMGQPSMHVCVKEGLMSLDASASARNVGGFCDGVSPSVSPTKKTQQAACIVGAGGRFPGFVLSATLLRA